MDPSHLKQDELEYELEIRGVAPAGTFEDMVEQFREARGYFYEINIIRANTNRDNEKCVDLVRELGAVLNFGIGALLESPAMWERLKSRKIHLVNRARRMNSSIRAVEITQEEVARFARKFEELSVEIQNEIEMSLSITQEEREEIRRRINTRNVTFGNRSHRTSSPVPNQNNRQEPPPIPPRQNTSMSNHSSRSNNPFLPDYEEQNHGNFGNLGSGSSTAQSHRIRLQSTAIRPEVRNQERREQEREGNWFERDNRRLSETFSIGTRNETGNFRPVGSIIKGWNVHYDGKGENLLDFWQRIKEFSEAEGIEDGDLLRCGIYLFKGNALTWYRVNHKRFQSFTSLMEEYSKLVLSPNHDYELKRQIQERIQRPNEPFSVFVANIELMCERLSEKLPENEKLWVLRENMRPEYENTIDFRKIKSVTDLEEECRQVELGLERTRRFQLRANESERVNVQKRVVQPSRNGSGVSDGNQWRNTAQVTESTSNPKCFNCGETGHFLRDCPKARSSNLRCGVCGKEGIRTNNCRHENTQSGNRQ